MRQVPLTWVSISRWPMLGMLAMAIGCGDVKLPTSLDEAKQAVSNTAEQVKEAAPTALQQAPAIVDAGTIELNVGGAIKANRCTAQLAIFSGGRPAVLQLKSYAGEAGDSYPAVYLRAILPEGATAPTAGQTLQADAYVQASADSPLWRSDDAAPIELSITAVDDKQVSGSVSRGALANTSDGARVDVTGTFRGLLSAF
jgi:hypothetical protein